MSLEERLEKWLRRMGYDNKIPQSLKKVCAPSVEFIWEQVISNVKPRQEVDIIRKNIVVNRITNASLDDQHEFSYPLKEIQVYLEKRDLEKKRKFLENSIEEEEATVDDLLRTNKTIYVAVDALKTKVDEMRDRKYLLENKRGLIENAILSSQEDLNLARNLTPVEMEEDSSGDHITETLQKCAVKLEKLMDKMCVPKSHIRPVTTPLMNSSKSRDGSILEGIKRSEVGETYSGKCNSHLNTENISMHNTCTDVNNSIKDCHETELDFNNTKNAEQNRKESLGLLPDHYLTTSDEFDEVFLYTSDKLHCSTEKLLSGYCHSFNDSCSKIDSDCIEKICNDKYVNEMLKNLLYNHNRYLIFKKWQHEYEVWLEDVRNSILDGSKTYREHKVMDKINLSDLHLAHVITELEKDKCRIILERLRTNVKQRTEEIQELLCTKFKDQVKIRRIFKLKIMEAEVIGANNFLLKQKNQLKTLENDNEKQMLAVQLRQLKDGISHTVDCIQLLTENTSSVLECIKKYREETSLSIVKLRPCCFDLSWTNRLKESVQTEEINTFEKFPLAFNRRLTTINSKILNRNIADTAIPSYVGMDPDKLESFTTLVDIPFCSAESSILSVVEIYDKLARLKLSQLPLEDKTMDCRTYSSTDFHKREGYIQNVINKLSAIISSSSVKEVLLSPDYMKQVVDLWTQLPVRNYISDKRLVNGQTYMFYENIFCNKFNKKF